LIIIDLSSPKDENKSSLKNLNIKNSVIYCFNDKKSTYQKKYRRIRIHPIDIVDKNFHFDMVKSLHEQLYNWANETEIDNENIFKFLNYKDIPSTYWLLDNWQLFITILDYYKITFLIKEIIDNNIEEEITIICSSKYKNFIDNNYKNNRNFLIINSSFSKNIINYIKYIFTKSSIFFWGLLIFIGLPIFSFVRKFYYLLIKEGKVNIKNNEYAIFSPAFHYHNDSKNNFYDKIMDPWQQFLKDNDLSYFYLDFIDFSGSNVRALRLKTKNDNNYLPLDYFFNFKLLIRYLKGSFFNFIKIKKVLSKLKELEFLEGNNPLHIENEIRRCIYITPFITAYYEALFSKFLKSSNVKKIIMCSEAGIIGRIFNPIGQKYGTELIGIQHGVLGNASFPYFHIEKHINKKDYTNSNRSSKLFTLPNKTVVWSEKAKSDLIMRGKYPNDSLIVIGKMNNGKNKKNTLGEIEKLKRLHNIPVDKKIILLAMRTGGKGLNKEFDLKCLNMVYPFSKIENDFFILSKLHPLEEFILYNKVKKNLSISENQLSITKNINIKTAILISDIVVSVRSTTIFEAMEYNKPIIIINPDHISTDAKDWSKTGAVFYATNQNEMKSILKNILNNPLSKEMIKNQDNCLRDFLGEDKINKAKIMEDLLLM